MPDRERLLRLCQSLACLDACLCAEWEDRYYSFNQRWDANEQLGSMRDGSGDEWRAHFTPHGAILFGLGHESEAYRHGEPHPEILSAVPDCFRPSVEEPAFDTENLSFCLWSEGSSPWKVGPIDVLGEDGSEELLGILDANPATYRAFAREYFEHELGLDVIEQIYAHQPLSSRLLEALQVERTLPDLREDLLEIGYPFNDD